MTCDHANTYITNSRSPADMVEKGYKKIPYDCIKARRRTCKDCGERFTTIEVRLDVMNQFNPAEIRKNVYEKLRRFMSADEAMKP